MSLAHAASLQAAVYTCLVEDPTVASLAGGSVFDGAPVGAPPDLYVALGTGEVRVDRDASGTLASHKLEVSVVGTEQGFHLVKTLAGAVETALIGSSLPLPSGRVAGLRLERARARRERNGVRRRVDLIFRALVDDSEV